MRPRPRIPYFSHRGRRRHETTYAHRFGSGLLLPFLIVAISMFIATNIVFTPASYVVEAGTLLAALVASTLRLFGAYLLALILGIPLGLLAQVSPKVENFLLPIYDVLESLPVLAFFPVIILFFLHSGLLEGAAVFIIFFSMLWTIAFSVIGGMRVIPQDIQAVGKVFRLFPFSRFKQIILPALFPPLLTASILAIADGWNIVIVAEALHAYAPDAAAAHDLFGIGSILVAASTNGQTTLLLSAMTILVIAIALTNLFLWQPLLSKAETYKFE